jgi:two-component system chemotaxis response regulator CheB
MIAPTLRTGNSANRAITVMIVDDSAVVRKYLSDLLTSAGIEVLATASDPLFAWPKMQARWPDVLVLDVEMPRMDGLSFLRKVMTEHPLPVVMCSTLTESGAATTLQALAEGAVVCVTKPKLGLRDFLEDPGNGLVQAVRAASHARVRRMAALPATNAVAAPARRLPTLTPETPSSTALAETTDRVIAIGSSTGGVQAIESVLTALPRNTPGIVIVQHMPEKFTAAMAQRLNNLCQMEVREAADGDRVITGRVLIAPGGRQMQLQRSGAQYIVSVRDGPLVNRHKPSVDVLFKSVAQCVGRNALGMILTGMGDDGARGMRDMHDAGARTVAQDEATCVVFGMPKEAIKHGGAQEVLPLQDMAGWIHHMAQAPLSTA